MREEALEGHAGVRVTIDMCAACQAFWFDARESLRLSPASTLHLFRRIGEYGGTPRAVVVEQRVGCPRCAKPLVLTRDLQGSTRFEYRRCPDDHGRLTGFVDFLKEKSFVRALTKPQIEELKLHLKTVQCSNCGAPVDLAKGSTCAHCRSPLSMLDMKQAGKLIDQLRRADERGGKSIDPTLPLRLAKARREVDMAFGKLPAEQGWFEDAAADGLVTAGLRVLGRLLSGV
jgi:hypothetical protein